MIHSRPSKEDNLSIMDRRMTQFYIAPKLSSSQRFTTYTRAMPTHPPKSISMSWGRLETGVFL